MAKNSDQSLDMKEKELFFSDIPQQHSKRNTVSGLF
jgi:hypothetical protein